MAGKGLHLLFDPVGGIAGDMLCAAMLDAFPEHLEGLRATIAALEPPVGSAVSVETLYRPLRGSRFRVLLPQRPDHRHRHWRDIRVMLERGLKDAGVRGRALAIFEPCWLPFPST